MHRQMAIFCLLVHSPLPAIARDGPSQELDPGCKDSSAWQCVQEAEWEPEGPGLKALD